MEDHLSHAIKKFREWTKKVENFVASKDPKLRDACQRAVNWAQKIRELDEQYYVEKIRSYETSLLSKAIIIIYDNYSVQYLQGSRKHGQFTKARQEKLGSFVYQFAAYLLPIAEEIGATKFLKEKLREFISEYSGDLLFDPTNIGEHEINALLEIASKAEELKIQKKNQNLRNNIEAELIRRQLQGKFEKDLQGESLQVEYKERIPDDASKLSREVAAFASTEGGRIYLGISDKGKIIGLNVKDSNWFDELQQKISNTVSDNIAPIPRLSVGYYEIGNKKIVKIEVEKGPEPMYYWRNIPFVRQLSTSRPATPANVKSRYLDFFKESLE